jgi:RNA polymerase sigma-70 factor (ECF subfamily)
MTEEELIKGCLKEDRNCQLELYKMFSGKMFSVCLRYSNTREDAEDALQEAFVKIFDNLSKFRFDGSFEGWMRRVTVNTALRLVQKKTPLQFAEDIATTRSIADQTTIIESINERDLMKIVNTLPQGYKVVFNMYAVEGYTHAEIGAILGITESTSRSQFARARKSLQHNLQIMYQRD